jgi:hypothetical protein
MRPLDDILIGFFIFFAIDRIIRLFSGTVVTDFARRRGASETGVENWKLATEAVILTTCIVFVWRWRHALSRLNKM